MMPTGRPTERPTWTLLHTEGRGLTPRVKIA